MKDELLRQISLLKEFFYLFLEFLTELGPVKFARYILERKWLFVLVVLSVNVAYYYTREGWVAYKEEYERVNAESQQQQETSAGMQIEEIADGLYTMTGTIENGDCGRILKELPTEKPFTVILESPGGNLAEGSCIAAHLKIRKVTTVVRDTPVFDENNRVIYYPGLIDQEKRDDDNKENVICASACGLIFLGGDKRYLIGDVWFGIHGPSTPPNVQQNPSQAEQGAFQTASKLLNILEDLGVDDPDTRRLFIQIPGYSMYWLKPTDFSLREGLPKIATHYRDFWGYTASNNEAVLQGGK